MSSDSLCRKLETCFTTIALAISLVSTKRRADIVMKANIRAADKPMPKTIHQAIDLTKNSAIKLNKSVMKNTRIKKSPFKKTLKPDSIELLRNALLVEINKVVTKAIRKAKPANKRIPIKIANLVSMVTTNCWSTSP